MNWDKVYLLADKYFNGESSVAEEKELRYYLLHEDIPDDMLELKSQFLAYRDFSDVILDKKFEQNLWEAINKSETATAAGKALGGNKHPLSYWITGVAAALLILLTVWITTDIFKAKSAIVQNNNPALAYRQVAGALSLLAVNFDKGLAQTQMVAKPLNTSFDLFGNVEMVNKGIESLEPVNKISNLEIIKYNNNH